MTTKTDIMDFWPDASKEPRPEQITALKWIEQNVGKKKYLFLEAPVGSGKSLIGVTLARYLEEQSYILTPQRILQKQYEDEFVRSEQIHLRTLYGRVNYTCANKGTNCDTGSLTKPQCPECPHKEAKGEAEKATATVLNYDLALLYLSNPESKFNTRKLMVLDECHVMEQILTEFDAISITFNQMQRMGIKWSQITDIAKAHTWVIENYLPALTNQVEDLEGLATNLMAQGSGLTPDEVNLIKDYETQKTHLDIIQEFEFISVDNLKQNYILVHDKLNVKFKRLYAGTSFNRYFRPMADHFLFMSSTIINYEGYCKDNGIPAEEATFLSLESGFPEENREVFYMPQMKMNVQWDKPQNQQSRKNMLAFINQLCSMHKDDNGIIHTANFKIAEWLVENLKCPQQIFHHNPDCGDDRNSVIQAFQEVTKPSILISPSITEGLDLYDDRARFAIIAKVSYPYLGDQWIKARQELSDEWYRRKALISIIQGCGRIVRSKNDYGSTYIVDASWEYLFNRSLQHIPTWWIDSYRVLS